VLPSWRPGEARDAILTFLDASESVPVAERVACFDNDGTLCCERPAYIQLEFFLAALRDAIHRDATLAERAEFAAISSGDQAAIDTIGLPRIAVALAGLFEGMTPEAFAARARAFMDTATHTGLDRPMRATVYAPMLELIAELRRRYFSVGIVSGGGTEFVRAVSEELYGVPAELVVGTLISYELQRDAAGRPVLQRTASILGEANEGATKVTNIQTQLGRRPILAAGNSSGDREMLEWATASDHPSLALLVHHDDDEREYAYTSVSATLDEAEPIVETAGRLNWTLVSMAADWDKVFSASP
jgi:phosphoserine phosphatase